MYKMEKSKNSFSINEINEDIEFIVIHLMKKQASKQCERNTNRHRSKCEYDNY